MKHMLRGALAGAVVTFAMSIIPVVHIVTLIPAPFIGGYFAGVRIGATPRQAFLVGALMSAILIVPVGGMLMLSSLLFFELTATTIMLISGAYATYVAAMGSLGAIVGGASTRRHGTSR